MRIVVITACILLSFLVAAFWFGHYIENSCAQLLTALDKLDQAAMAEDWEAIETEFQKVHQEWEKNRGVWIYVLEHYDINAIDLELARLERYIYMQDTTHTVVVVGELKFEVELIREKESLSFANLF